MPADEQDLVKQFIAIEREIDGGAAAPTAPKTTGAKQAPAAAAESSAAEPEKANGEEGNAAEGRQDGQQGQQDEGLLTETEQTEETQEGDEPEAEPEASKEKPAEKTAKVDGTVAVPKDREEQRKLLAACARELGMVVNESRVEPEQWVHFRQEKKQLKQRLAEKEQQIEQERSKIAQANEQLEAARKAASSGDYDAFLKATLGIDVRELNERHVQGLRGRDPELEKEKALIRAERERMQREREETEQQKKQQAAEQQRRAYVGRLHGHLSQHQSSEYKALAEAAKQRPELIEMIVDAQDQAYDPDDDTTISADDAAYVVLNKLREDYQVLSQIFGVRSPSKTEATADGPANRDGGNAPAKRSAKNRTVPQRKASEASPAGRSMSDDEWKRLAESEMKKALAADIEAGL